jgi:tetratricopeptide (TPR) repeat protein
MYFLPAERLRLYRNFKAIEANDFHGIARFYEQHEDGIRALDFDEYLDCTLVYANALFEAADYGKHLVMCDHLLEVVIMQNVDNWGGEDLYHRLLFKKSASLYHLQEHAKSERILREIVKIYPNDPLAALYLNKVLLRQKPVWLFRARAATVVFALLAVLVIALEILALPAFFPHLLQPFQIAHNLLIALSLATLSVAEAMHAFRSWWRTRRFVLRARQKKQGDAYRIRRAGF